MHTRYRVIEPDGSWAEHEAVYKDRWPTLPELHATLDPILGTTHFEHVRVWWAWKDGGPSEYLSMFVDEDGISKGLPVSDRATAIYHENVRYHDPRGMGSLDALAVAPKIHGTAVLFKESVWK